jgi:hypothetical protein
MTLKDLIIDEDDFDVFIALNPAEKIEFLWDALRLGIDKSVDKQVTKLEKDYESSNTRTVLMSVQDMRIGPYHLTVMSIDRLIVLNSDNLKVIRNFVKQMWNNGYIVSRRQDIRKAKNSDMMKYFVAYEIIGEGNPISEN